MNIKHCLANTTAGIPPVKCPRCQFCHIRKYSSYTRKGFYVLKETPKIPMIIKRYRCLNPDCNVCTFSVLPCGVLRYCRFFYPGLLQVKNALSSEISFYKLARYVWHLRTRVIKRAAGEISRIGIWVTCTFREISDGGTVQGFNAAVKYLTHNMGSVDLTERYGYYPHRLACAK